MLFTMNHQLDFDAVQKQISWLRESNTDTVIEQTARALRDGVEEDVLWAAGALTAMRYIKNEAHNLLGFVSHAMIACEDARRLAKPQKREIRHLLLMQALYQVAFDLNDPCLSPYQLLPARPYRAKSLEENISLLRTDVRMGEYLRADARLVAIEQDTSRDSLIDLLLDIGLEGMVTDDHTMISPILCLGLIELVGWERGFDMLRCTLRYSASFPRNFAPYDRAVKLLGEYGLETGSPQTEYQPERIESLRQQFHQSHASDRPEIAARAMAQEGYSPATILAAVTLVAADMYLCASPVPHQDFDAISREVAPIHIGTSTNGLRSSLAFLTPRTQALAAVQGGSLLERGPSVLNSDFEFVPFTIEQHYPYRDDVISLKGKSSQYLLSALREALYGHDYRISTAAVKAYAETGEQPKALIALLTEIACTDDGTLLHSFKHLNAMTKEFYASSHPDRWQYLIAAARFMTWYAGLNTNAYRRAAEVVEYS